MQLGRYEVFSVVNGWIRLDGGAMFGVVPRVLWEKTQDVDAHNRILMAMRTLVIVDGSAGRLMLVDTGAGSKWQPDKAKRYAIEDLPDALETALARRSLGVDDVTDVVITHAHFDHCGGLTEYTEGPGSEIRPRFCRAKHWVHAEQLAHALDPADKDRASYIRRDFEALANSDLLVQVTDEDMHPPLPGIEWLVSYGHTPGLLLPVIRDGEAPLLFTGDMIPTAAHLPPLWVMAYDLQPLVTIEEKKRVLSMCQDEGLLLAFPHDRSVGIARIDMTDGKPTVQSPLDLDP